MLPDQITQFGIIIFAIHTLGLFTAIDAIMKSRTSQGAIAWALTLIYMPYFALPAYWIFGRSKFQGYIDARRIESQDIRNITQSFRQYGTQYVSELDEYPDYKNLEEFAEFPFTKANDVQLLIDGEATFAAIFTAIEQAKEYILVQFYIVRDDDLGQRLQQLLIQKAKAGVRVYFLYDEIGSYQLSKRYLTEMRDAKVEVHAFHTTKGRGNRFQLNFRNHRKIVIIDGKVAFIGGHNVGDEYLGKGDLGAWRDTHIRLVGPAVMSVQWVFLEDWNWAAHSIPEFQWKVEPSDNNMHALILPTGPADAWETCSMFFVQSINSAKQRVWIASPYFVPDQQVLCALQMAALRGCDVRILLPEKPDHISVYLSSFHYIAMSENAGVRFFRYQAGFNHQKAMLVDNGFSAIGTANLDNRSFRLNFEITAAIIDETLSKATEEMFLEDFSKSAEVEIGALAKRSYWFRLIVSISRLFSPIQ